MVNHVHLLNILDAFAYLLATATELQPTPVFDDIHTFIQTRNYIYLRAIKIQQLGYIFAICDRFFFAQLVVNGLLVANFN